MFIIILRYYFLKVLKPLASSREIGIYWHVFLVGFFSLWMFSYTDSNTKMLYIHLVFLAIEDNTSFLAEVCAGVSILFL